MTQSHPEGAANEEGDAGEEDLLLRYRNGDAGAFAQLVSEYRSPVYSYLVRSGVPEADRDDLFQEIFVRLHSAARRFHNGRPLHPWFFTIVANAVRTYHRRRRLRELVFSTSTAPDEPAIPAPDGERGSEARKTLSWLEGEIRKLPLQQREVLILVCIEGISQKQVAEVLGSPLGTIKTQLRRARLALTQKLARRGAARDGEAGS